MLGNNIRVTENVNNALHYAISVAHKFGSYEVDTDHLLYGICKIANSVASKMLASYGITDAGIENCFNKIYKRSTPIYLNEAELNRHSKDAFVIAHEFATQIGFNVITTEHILVGILVGEDTSAINMIKRNFRVNINDLKNQVLQALKSHTMSFMNDNMYGSYDEQQNYNAYERSDYNPRYQNGESSGVPESIKDLGIDLTQKARDKKIDPIIGREDETNRVIEILCRKNKNNPVLIGDAGVGKSAVVDGLALAIANNQVPDLLKNKTIFSLDLGSLMAGTKYRGALEEKLKSLIDVITNNRDIIVFIDEIHTLMQVGGDKGEVNPADMLKPYLARGEFQTIGATTTDEYRKYIEKDKALERRFQPVIVNPPTVEQTIEILKGLKEKYEAYHKVTISDEAIKASAVLSDRYIMDRSLPDKAIDLIDEASSKAKIQGKKKPEELANIEYEIKKYEDEKHKALLAEDFEKSAIYRDKLKDAQKRHQEILEKLHMGQSDSIVITEEDISHLISEWTKIPISKITASEKERLLKLEDILHKRVIGQDEAVTQVCKAVRRSRIGLKDAKRPIGSFMFLGQTGVGKTELCKALAEAMFDSENAYIRLDMSEYMEKHSVSKLIGSPPGYVGFDEGGQLTESVRRKPYSVVLFDEIEKAHPDVFNLLLQVLDDGRLTDSQGRTVSFKNTIIIFTSNIGVSELPKKAASLGFAGDDSEDKELSFEVIKETLTNAFKRSFRPEFVNRIDVITVFHPLSPEQLSKIAKIFINNLNKKLVEQNITLKVTESALRYLTTKGYDRDYGARPLRRLIEQEVEDRIAEYLLEETIVPGDTIIISAKEGYLSIKVEENM